MNIVFGLLTGFFTGILQIYLLGKFTKGVTSSDTGKTHAYVAAGAAQLILPFAVLVTVAFLYIEALLWAGIGAGTSLIILSVIRIKKEG